MVFRKIFQHLCVFLSFGLNPLFTQVEQDVVLGGVEELAKEQKEQSPALVVKDVSEEWKEEVTKQFEQDVAKIKQIIVEGERNKQDLKDFLGRFEDQKQWFDMNVSATKNFFDPTYNAVMQKKLSFKRLIKAQDRAEEILKELVDEEKLSVPVKRQIKLAVLYNLNSLIQKEVEKGRAELCDFGISDFEIRRVVTRVFSEVEKKRAEEHEIERMVKKDVEELEKQIDILRKGVDQQEIEKEQIKAKVSNLETELVQKRKSNKELERLLKKIEEDKELLKDEIGRRTAFQIRKELKPVIERKNKENMELQLHLKKLEQELKVIKNDLGFRPKSKKVSKPVQKNEQENLSKSNADKENSNRQEPEKELEKKSTI